MLPTIRGQRKHLVVQDAFTVAYEKEKKKVQVYYNERKGQQNNNFPTMFGLSCF